MATKSIVDVAREFRQKHQPVVLSQTVVSHEVSWELPEAIASGPILGSTMVEVSNHVDRLLKDYCSIHKTRAAVRGGNGTPFMDAFVSYEDEQIARDPNGDHFIRLQGDIHEETEDAPDEELTNAVIRETVSRARNDGLVVGAIYSDGEVDLDVHECDSNDSECPIPNWKSVAVRRSPYTKTESIRVFRVNEGPLENPNPDGSAPQTVSSAGVDEEDSESPRDVEPLEGTKDIRLFSHCILRDQDLQEVNDEPLRPLRPSTGSVREVGFPEKDALLDTTSYVTSYELDHVNSKINARIVTAPSNVKIDYRVWFQFNDDVASDDLAFHVRRTMKANLSVMLQSEVSRYRHHWERTGSASEEVALNTLREMISEAQYRRYLKYGFVTVAARSGSTYQIFRDRWHTNVWRDGNLVEEVCIRLGGHVEVPPTDQVIGLLTMVSIDEEAFLKAGNRYRSVPKVS